MRFLVSGFWLHSGKPFSNEILTSEPDMDPEEDTITFFNMDEQDIIDAMSPNERYTFIITEYRAL